MMKNDGRKGFSIDGCCPVTFEFSWDLYSRQHSGGLISGCFSKQDSTVDCDASAYLIRNNDGKKTVTEEVTYDHPTACGGAVRHRGDNIESENRTNTEKIEVNFAGVSAEIDEIIFTLDLFKAKQKQLGLGKFERIYVNLYKSEGDELLQSFSVSGVGGKAIRAGMLKKCGDQWEYIPHPENLKGALCRDDLRAQLVQE